VVLVRWRLVTVQSRLAVGTAVYSLFHQLQHLMRSFSGLLTLTPILT